MKILIVGDEHHLQEFTQKFGKHEYSHVSDHHQVPGFLSKETLVFDFIIDENPEEFYLYADQPVTVFMNTCKISLAELVYSVSGKLLCNIFGFNGLPTLLNRSIFEVSTHGNKKSLLEGLCKDLNTEYLIVEDRVGMVTPRVISMIINEAYYTVQEGTASRADIDLAMKLGTNYPFGPFEWCQRIGLKHIYEVLDAVYEDTKDERYKICPLLKREYLHLG